MEAIWGTSFKIRGNIVVLKHLSCVCNVLLPHSSLIVYLTTMQYGVQALAVNFFFF